MRRPTTRRRGVHRMCIFSFCLGASPHSNLEFLEGGCERVMMCRRSVVRSNGRKEQLNNPRNICAYLVYLQINLFIPGRKVASIYFQQFRDTIGSGCDAQEGIN